MQTFFDAYPANSGRLQFAPPFSDHIEEIVLSAGVLQSVAIPAWAQFATFSFDGDVRVKPGIAGTFLELPVASTVGGGGSDLNPAARRLTAAPGSPAFTHLHLRSAAACAGSVSFFA